MGEVAVRALSDANLELYQGEFLVISGPSGSGKSTLLNLIGGMDRPSTGAVIYQNTDLALATEQVLTEYRRTQIGFVFQFYNLVPSLTALENVQVATEIAQQPMQPLEALAMVGLTERAQHFPGQLSGGEQQRVAIARALAGNPKLLLCDEPTGALDMHTSRQVLGMLKRFNKELGVTVVLITHNSVIADIADRVAYMRDGCLHDLRINTEPKPVTDISW
ncbi:MAG: ATP-binding cassette domain-containing protein [Methyloprofundus sp.]|nr:ATP-binding cassette domain-containing protein [Methyloprofundus sp.]